MISTPEKNSGDLETIEGFYKDRGYADFKLTSTQVSITPDREQVISRWPQTRDDVFTINEVNLAGELGDVR